MHSDASNNHMLHMPHQWSTFIQASRGGWTIVSAAELLQWVAIILQQVCLSMLLFVNLIGSLCLAETTAQRAAKIHASKVIQLRNLKYKQAYCFPQFTACMHAEHRGRVKTFMATQVVTNSGGHLINMAEFLFADSIVDSLQSSLISRLFQQELERRSGHLCKEKPLSRQINESKQQFCKELEHFYFKQHAP